MLIYHKAISPVFHCPLAEKSVDDCLMKTEDSCVFHCHMHDSYLHRDEISDDSDDVPNTELYCHVVL